MQKIFTNFKLNSRTVISLMVIICLFALGIAFTASLPSTNSEQPIVAQAATSITSSNFRSVIQNNGSTATITGDYELTSDISISVTSGVNLSTFNGTFNGNGYTITVTGKDTYTASRNTDNYVGIIFGQLGTSATIKNLKIVWDAYWNVMAYNNATSEAYSGNGSTTVYVGGLCGLAQNGAKIEDVTFALNSTIAGIGIDDGSNHETQTGGQGAVVGAMIGRSRGAKMKNITYTNNGSVWARGNSLSAGSNRKGVTVSLSQPDTRGDRAAAGGLIGEIESNSTTINGLVFKGDGYVGAATTGANSYAEYNTSTFHTINFAGGLVGFTYGGTLTITGMLYEYTGQCYVKESVTQGKNAGTILGKGSGVTINSLWRRTDDTTSASGIGVWNYYSNTSGPSKSGSSSGITIQSTLGSGSVTTVAQGATASSSNVYATKEYKPTAYYSGSTVNFATGVITDIKNGYLTIKAVSNDTSYIISALSYNLANNGAYTNKNYYNVAQANTVVFNADEYQIPVNCYEFRVVLATMQKAMYVNCSGNKVYDTLGISFTGAASSTNLRLLDDLYWASEHNTDSSNNTQGDLGSASVTTGANVGTYSMKLMRYDSSTGTSSPVKDGDSLGSNTQDAPSIIYQFDASAAENYRYTISRAEVDLVQFTSASFEREYDGTPNVRGDDLTYKLHYGFYLAGTTTEPKDTPVFTIGSGSFYDSTGTLLDGSVGSNKVVKIEGIEVTGNYILSSSSGNTLTLSNCRITERSVQYQWDNLTQVYNGNLIKPTIVATNLVDGDSVQFSINVYNSLEDALLNIPITTKTDVKDGTNGDNDYYIVRATIASNPNYVVSGGYAEAKLYVTPKTIGLTWTSFNEVFSYTDNQVQCVVTNASTAIASGDDVGLSITYYHNETATVTTLRNAGTYVATATISNTNYRLEESTTTFSNIVITPISIDIVFYTGADSSSNEVQDLVYKGVSYIDDVDGLHAKLAPNAVGKGLVNQNISISYNGMVVTVGTYTATATLVDSDENTNDDIIITNYQISSATHSLNIIQREVTLSYDVNTFVYDGLSHTVDAIVDEGRCEGDNIAVRSSVTIFKDGVYVVTTAIDAGNYLVQYSLNNSNYKIKTGYDSYNLTITQYDIAQTGTKVTIDPISDVTYSGVEQTPNVIVRFDGAIMQSQNYRISSINNNKNAGTATITIEGTNNFKGSMSTSFNILKAMLTISFNTATTRPYNGQVQEVSAQFVGYKGSDEVNNPVGMLIDYGGKTPKDAGSYTATASFSGTPTNYVISSELTDRQFTFEITKKTVDIVITGYNDLVFDGNSHKYQEGVNDDGIKVSFKDATSVCDGDDLGLSLQFNAIGSDNTEPRNAGAYKVTASLTGSSINNYTISSTSLSSLNFSIAPYYIDVEFDLSTVSHVYSASYKSASYNVSASTPLIEDEDPDISLQYAIQSTGATTQGNPINAGNYLIKVKLGNSNYTTDTSKTQNFVINKAPLQVEFNLSNGGNYTYDTSKKTIEYGFVSPYVLLGADSFNLDISYLTDDGSAITECRDAGTYSVVAKIPTTQNNYYIINTNDEFNSAYTKEFTINPRYLSVQFSMNSDGNTYYYTGEELTVGASVGDGYGIINDASYYNSSGLANDGVDYEQVSFIVTLYQGTTQDEENIVESILNVGTYNATVRLDENNITNKNYVIYELNQTDYPTTSTIVINPREIIFRSSGRNFSKTWGDLDGALVIQLTADNTNNGILGNDEIYVQLIRQAGEDVGTYNYTGFNVVEKVVNGSSTTWNPVDPAQFNGNYSINYYGKDGDSDVFEIIEKVIEFTPPVFTFDYKQDISPLVYEIHGVSEVPEIGTNGNYVITITLESSAGAYNGADAGTYDLSTSATDDNPNVKCVMKENSHEDKIIILGRSVQVTLDTKTNDYTYYVTYGETITHSNGTTSYEPDYYAGLEVEIDKCDSNITEENFKEYIRITREVSQNEITQGGIPYRESGYNITIQFLKKLASGDFVVDKNYRAVNENGEDATYKLMVNKFDLNTVFYSGNTATQPTVITKKDYDGSNKVQITNDMIPEKYVGHGLRLYASYDDKNAGENKTISLHYYFSMVSYENNYILPGNIVNNEGILEFTSSAIINRKELTVTFGEGNYGLTYGEHFAQNPDENNQFEKPYPNILYSGFVVGDSLDNVNLNLSIVYKLGTNYTSIESIKDAGEHTLAIINNEGEHINYSLDISATRTVTIARRLVTVSAGNTFVKTVDGSKTANITTDNYVINGMIERDAMTANSLTLYYHAELNSVEPGATTVTMTVLGLGGTQSTNYYLPDDEEYKIVEIPAEIRELAIVNFESESYSFDFDNTIKPVTPIIDADSVQDNVKYILKYKGKRYDGKEYVEQNTAPKSAGIYTVTCWFYHQADENDITKYRALASAEIVINKITPSLYFTGTFTQTYGSFTGLSASVKAPGLEESLAVRYSFENEDGSLPTFPPQGVHTASATFEETNDYLDVSGTQTLQIKSKTISVSFDEYRNLVYNGYNRNDDIKVYFNGVVEGDTCVPVKIFMNVNDVKDAGTYRLIVTPSNPSYTISGSNSLEFTVQKKVLKVSVPDNITTYSGIAPKINLIYEGFVENEGVDDIAVLPTPKITSGKVGINVIEFNEGYDENYSFNYIQGVYTIVYESKNQDKPNVTPYVVTGCAVGGIALIFGLGYLVKIGNYKAITRGVAKRKIRKEMMGKKK